MPFRWPRCKHTQTKPKEDSTLRKPRKFLSGIFAKNRDVGLDTAEKMRYNSDSKGTEPLNGYPAVRFELVAAILWLGGDGYIAFGDKYINSASTAKKAKRKRKTFFTICTTTSLAQTARITGKRGGVTVHSKSPCRQRHCIAKFAKMQELNGKIFGFLQIEGRESCIYP